MQIGFIGLGQMGLPIARNISAAPGDYVYFDRRPERRADLRGPERTVTPRLSDLAPVDALFLCLPGDDAVTEVLFGENGVAPLLRSGAIVVDMGTTGHATTLEVAHRLSASGIDFIDAPVSGMQKRAEDATLTIMCGGDRPLFERVEPLLARAGNLVLHLGPPGAGQLAKLINQLLFDINAAALAEILPMAVYLGLDPDKIGSIVNSGTGCSYASEFFVPRMLAGNFRDGYPLAAAYKDLVSASRLTTERRIATPVLAAATATYQQALLNGFGADDKGGMLKVFENLLGVQFRTREKQTNA